MGELVLIEVHAQPALTELDRLTRSLPQVIGFAEKDITRKVRYDLLSTTRSWSGRPDFQTVAQTHADGFTLIAGTDDRIWNMLDVGTRAHPIFPKRPGGVLVFPGGPYTAKTTPGWLGSRPGGPSGPMIFRKFVFHPGTRPRDWIKLLTYKWRTEAPAILRQYIERWSRP